MPEKRDCLLALAASYIHTNAPENAIRILQPALEKNARDPEALKLLTECYSAERDTVNLITTLERRLVLEPGNFEINFQLGEIFMCQGNNEKAIQAFERARKAKPSDESAKRKLLELLKKKK
jgi:cytochrome c-type biogenesis protein CcmH/NrfG